MTILLTGDQAYKQFRKVGLLPNTDIDLTGATFIFDNNPATPNEQRVPIFIEKSPGVRLRGGRVNGLVDLALNVAPGASYIDGSAMRILQSPDFTVEDFRSNRTWDGIRFRDNSNNFTFRRIHISLCPDDILENDYGHGGLVEDSLLSGGACIMGLALPSSAPSATTGKNNKIIFRNTFGRCQIFNKGGEMTHGAPFKCDTGKSLAEDRNPQMEFYDSVIAIQDINHNGMSRHKRWVRKAKGFGANTFYLNLSDKPLPSTYGIPVGFQKLQGSAAREKWAAVEKGWLAGHPTLN